MKQLLLDIKPIAHPSLQNFVIGRNAEALSNLISSIENRSHFIFIWGEKGCGKTHLLSACDSYGVKVADDVHLLDNDAQIDLFNQYNQLKESGEILIAAGSHSPNQMGLRNDLATRLAWDWFINCNLLTTLKRRKRL